LISTITIMVSSVDAPVQILSHTSIALQSEYWVSHKKYWCKYCEVFIADDAPSRTQHENGLRHQGNKERFIRNLYKTGQQKKQDEDEEKREVARIEQVSRSSQDLCRTHDQSLYRLQEQRSQAM
jgi:U1 zinc finger